MRRFPMREGGAPDDAALSGDAVHFYIEAQTRMPQFYMPYEHTHSVLEFYYLHQGQCMYMINGSYVHLREGDIMIVAPHVRHNTSYTGRTASERIAVYINTEYLPEEVTCGVFGLRDMLSGSGKRILDHAGRTLIMNVLGRMADEQASPEQHSETLLSLYSGELLIQVLNHSTPAQDIFIPMTAMEPDIEKALHLIDTRFSQPLTLKSVSVQLGLNPAYFSHKFRVSTGHTFKEYLNNARIRQATHQLIVSDDSITKVAMDCGFTSSNYFKDLFRRYMGCSPRDYRKRATVSSKYGSGTAK
ncbi:helix-turn-helix transcriptional regulator [Lachnoclostridium sp. Marseille-P6806]|uniref:helix-turn-helix transcriptional regulator n=1 Tax=Lachnoclostridium sp. Marseille-P6806 TaxID=2364793 RepID=UPI0013EF0851|nr:AraC family transcriptional regulator [Lachnoclostridium sp. Marseille-P6806]